MDSDMEIAHSAKKVETYLASLTKKELIDLVLKLAPQTFFDAIEAQFASQAEAEAIFNQAEKAVDAILSDERLLYDPSQFEKKIMEQLGQLRGLWDKLPSEIGYLLLNFMREVDQAFENGYLYLESYDTEDDYFESEAVNDYIVRFASHLPSDLKSSYIEELKTVLEGAGYSTFFSIQDKMPDF
ncbi:MAG: hypothetical protein AAFQ63_18880 [Cyanobacteria bacterium J06621_11]